TDQDEQQATAIQSRNGQQVDDCQIETDQGGDIEHRAAAEVGRGVGGASGRLRDADWAGDPHRIARAHGDFAPDRAHEYSRLTQAILERTPTIRTAIDNAAEKTDMSLTGGGM